MQKAKFDRRIVALIIAALSALMPIGASAFGPSTVDRAAHSVAPTSYLIQPGDVMAISVWKEKDLQVKSLVLPDGTISFPLVGEIQAADRTVPQIRQEIITRLAKYMPDPVVTVAVLKDNGNQVYVIGEVKQAGAFVATRYLDVMQALSLAGGMTPYASENDIEILRRVNGKETAIPFEYAEVKSGKDLGQDIVLQAGDVVVVP